MQAVVNHADVNHAVEIALVNGIIACLFIGFEEAVGLKSPDAAKLKTFIIVAYRLVGIVIFRNFCFAVGKAQRHTVA